MAVRVGFLAPEGTFTHESAVMAADRLGWSDVSYIQYPTSVETVEAAGRGEVDYAVIVDGTSLGGPMPDVNKAIEVSGVRRVDQIQRVCHYHLLALPGATLGGLTAIFAHAKASADCRGNLERLAPGVPHLNTTSTAAGVKQVADDGGAEGAAVGTSAAAKLYGLVPLAGNIEDDPNNWTRWAVVTRNEE